MTQYIRIGLSNKLLLSAKESRELSRHKSTIREDKNDLVVHTTARVTNCPKLHKSPSSSRLTEKGAHSI